MDLKERTRYIKWNLDWTGLDMDAIPISKYILRGSGYLSRAPKALSHGGLPCMALQLRLHHFPLLILLATCCFINGVPDKVCCMVCCSSLISCIASLRFGWLSRPLTSPNTLHSTHLVVVVHSCLNHQSPGHRKSLRRRSD
jgi:hypothetical protein